jgi:FKBP-type peptidyl-prolyl cis-trans isomerase
MTKRNITAAILALFFVTACSGGQSDAEPESAESAPPATAVGEASEIVPGLSMRKLKNGYGRAAVAGDLASVHYTGWLFDEAAPDGRGEKFDSSVDRGQEFQFPLGAGRVIQGWDKGVEGMLIGETRELRIAPELGYGDRGAGAVIPPGATLVFEIELRDLRGPNEDG